MTLTMIFLMSKNHQKKFKRTYLIWKKNEKIFLVFFRGNYQTQTQIPKNWNHKTNTKLEFSLIYPIFSPDGTWRASMNFIWLWRTLVFWAELSIYYFFKWLVTAAHCNIFSAKSFDIYLGAYKLSELGNLTDKVVRKKAEKIISVKFNELLNYNMDYIGHLYHVIHVLFFLQN